MSEEEEKAIEEFEDLHCGDYFCDVILNLIEKQRKVIRELKKNELDFTTIYITGIFDGEKKCKDKIREKIKEGEDIWNYL